MRRPHSTLGLSLLCGTFLLISLAVSHWSRPTLARVRLEFDPQTAAPPVITWNEVAPILYGNCTACHHPHGNGPFSLLTYSDARRRGPQIVEVTTSHYMPPWLPAHGYGDFAGERRLSDAQITTLAAWVKAGMPEGNPDTAPAQPVYSDGWVGGKPDLILTVERPFSLSASGTDVFHNFILPFPLKGTRYVRAMEIRPSAPEVVHHANVLLDRTASLRRLHAADWQAGLEGMELNIDAGNSFDPDGHFLFWKSDSPLLEEPPEMPWELDAGNDLVLNMHLKPSGKTVLISAQIGLYFTPNPPAKRPMLLQLEHDRALDIPPGDAHFVVEDHLTLPVAVSVLGVYPHAHYLGKDLEAWAILPDGKKHWMIWIREWDIDRQAVYHFKSPVPLPKGSMVFMRYTYDNTAANPHNPHLPPVRVKAGNRSEDEMGHLWLQVLPVASADTKIDPRLPLEEAWMRRLLEKQPHDALAAYNLAAALEGEGRFQDAAAAYQAQLVVQPGDARLLNGLGGALESEGEWQSARKTYEQAVAASPDNCDARFNLARLELKHALATDAEAQFRTMLDRCPADAAVYDGLAASLAAQGKTDKAQAEFEQALQLDAQDFTANYSLGALHLEAGQTDTAIVELGRAVEANGHDADAREHLAMAYAQSGRSADAVAQLRTAVELAPDDADLRALLSQELATTGQLSEAIKQEQQSLKLRPDDPDQWNNLGVFEERSGNALAAEAAFRHALALRPGDQRAQANLARLQGKSAPAVSPQ